MPRKQKMYHYIYKTTCVITQRFYIGMHSTDNLNDNYIGSGKQLWRSINKHGREHHNIEILEFLPSRKSLANREWEIVNEELINNPLCMNLKNGGDGGWETLNKDPDYKWARIKGGQTIKNRCEFWLIHKNRMETDEKYKNKHNSSVSLSLKQRWAEHGHPWKGRKHTEETKQKQSDAKKGKCSGENNNGYGTCWMYHLQEEKNIKIKKENVEQYLLQGWIKGRKMEYYKPL